MSYCARAKGQDKLGRLMINTFLSAKMASKYARPLHGIYPRSEEKRYFVFSSHCPFLRTSCGRKQCLLSVVFHEDLTQTSEKRVNLASDFLALA